jgi:hypothetical protein
LSVQPAYQTQRSIGGVHHLGGPAGGQPLGGGDLGGELVAAALEHLGDAVEDLAAVVRRRAGPAGDRLARGDDGLARVLARGPRGVGEKAPFASLTS